MMMSDSETNKMMNEKDRQELLTQLIIERYGEWATRKDIIKDSDK